ncbi:hypothetical protein BDP81DRAFT_457083 [Colletotrichum phormii]|uniref:NAD(P)-binding protein n=1 Tax=Colletotrichum phormii TaxID=359342 RepID=A0AAJ0EKI3_9PEZI|nr:uncharacterized protein BDP81DRAFT_457083 [Colletotrichum phormii]KAK1656475.1 hypothetical protein BDP81DRAFT_457083 [Colletotrichum phormii]
MTAWEVNGKVALVTSSGINHALTRALLELGCSVINKLWDAALNTYGRVNLLVNGAGIYDPPSSDFSNPPGISPLSRDQADAKVGMYQAYAVNIIAPVRLAQIAVEYWLRPENRHLSGNILWIASMAGYVHGLLTPFYYSSKAAVVSMCKSLGSLNKFAGIRNAAVCPGAVNLSNIIEVFCGGTNENHKISVRDVPLESLYDVEGMKGMAAGTHMLVKQDEFEMKLKRRGLEFSAKI